MNRKLNYVMLLVIVLLCIAINVIKSEEIKVFLLGIQIGLAIYNATLNIIEIRKINREIKLLDELIKNLEKNLEKEKSIKKKEEKENERVSKSGK